MMYLVVSAFVCIGMLMQLFKDDVRHEVYGYINPHSTFYRRAAVAAYVYLSISIGLLWIGIIPGYIAVCLWSEFRSKNKERRSAYTTQGR